MKNWSFWKKLQIIPAIAIVLAAILIPDKLFTAYNVGVFIGILIALFIVKLTWYGIIWCSCIIEDMIMDLFKGTEYEKSLELFFRKLGNLLTRFKWTDPEKDLWKDFDKTVDDMYKGNFNR